MKPRLSLATMAIIVAASSLAYAENLCDAMQRVGLQSVLVVHSQAVDEQPVWSPKGDALAVNIEGKWVRVALTSVSLVPAQWHGGSRIGLVQPPPAMEPIDEETVRSWEKAGTYDPRRLQTKDGTVLELKVEELSTEFLITRKGSKPESQWKSGMENCHSLGLSPDEKYVAYICELNGVAITRIADR